MSCAALNARPRAELPAVIATVCGFAFSAGLLYPTIALMLERRGVSEDMIGQKFGEYSPTRTYYGHAADKKAKRK